MMFRPLLLLMPRLLPAHGPEDQQEGAEALQDGPPELRGVLRRQELHPLSLYKVSQHWDEAGASQGEKEEKRGVQRLGERKLRESRLRLGGGVRPEQQCDVRFLPD